MSIVYRPKSAPRLSSSYQFNPIKKIAGGAKSAPPSIIALVALLAFGPPSAREAANRRPPGIGHEPSRGLLVTIPNGPPQLGPKRLVAFSTTMTMAFSDVPLPLLTIPRQASRLPHH